MIVIVAVAVAAGGGGLTIGRRRGAKADPFAPVCTCRHWLSYHDPETGHCHGTRNGDPLAYDELNYPTAWKQEPCTCRQYVGPLPADHVIASFNNTPTITLPPPSAPSLPSAPQAGGGAQTGDGHHAPAPTTD